MAARALLLWAGCLLLAAGAGPAAWVAALEPVIFPRPGLYGPAAPLPVLDDDASLSERLLPRKPVDRAAAALRGVAGRLRALVAPSGGGSVNEGSGNLLMSPLSVAAALGQMLLGAQGETRGLLADLLAAPNGSGSDGVGAVPDLDYHQQFKSLLKLLGTEEPSAGEEAGVELRLASAFFAQRGLSLRVDFEHALHDLYHADVRYLDFRERPAVAQASVNAWARQATRGRIPTVLSAPLPPSAAALVASAVYFRGAWEWPFDSDLSVNGWFRMSPKRRVAVKFMRSHFSDMRYVENSAQGYRMAVLPYKDGKTVMYVILPDQKDTDLSTFSSKMSLERMMNIARSAQPHTVTLVLPRMSITGSFSLKEPLSKLKGARRLPRSVRDTELPDLESSSEGLETKVRSRSNESESGLKNLDPLFAEHPSGTSNVESSFRVSESVPMSKFSEKDLSLKVPQSHSQTWSLNTATTNQEQDSDSSSFTVLTGGSFESENVRKRRSALLSRKSRNAPEARSQTSNFPSMQMTIGTNTPQMSFRKTFPQSPVGNADESDQSKMSDSNVDTGVGEMLPAFRSASLNKPMVLGVPLRIVDSDDSNILPKIPGEYSSHEKDASGKPLQHSFRGMEIPYPYRPLPGQELKPPFDKPPKLLTIQDILPKIVVETSVSFPFDQSNESAPVGSKLTTRPSGLISKKPRDRVGSTQIRSVTALDDEDLVSTGSVSSVALVNDNSKDTVNSSMSSEKLPVKTDSSADAVAVSLEKQESKIENLSDKPPQDLIKSSPTGVSSTFPTPIMSFSSNIEYSEPVPIISSSVHVEHLSSSVDVSPITNASSSVLLASASSSPAPDIENRFSVVSSNSSVLPSKLSSTATVIDTSSSASPETPSNSTHSKVLEFPEIEETGDLLNPLSVGVQGLWTIRPQPANYAAYDDVVLDLTGASMDKNLRISDALHHVWLEVTETGTEAAAVTATLVDYSGDNKVMKVDRPFVMAIVHEPTEALLFLAAVSDPTGGAGVRTDVPPKKAAASAG